MLSGSACGRENVNVIQWLSTSEEVVLLCNEVSQSLDIPMYVPLVDEH